MVKTTPSKFDFKYIKHIPYKAMDWIGSTSSLVVHTFLFIGSFLVGLLGIFDWDRILLVVTTIVSLEAIYLSIFIQMGVNRTAQSLQGVEEDIEEIQEDVVEIQEDVQGLGEDVDVLHENMEDIAGDIDEIAQEETQIESQEKRADIVLDNIASQLQYLVKEVEILKGGHGGNGSKEQQK